MVVNAYDMDDNTIRQLAFVSTPIHTGRYSRTPSKGKEDQEETMTPAVKNKYKEKAKRIQDEIAEKRLAFENSTQSMTKQNQELQKIKALEEFLMQVKMEYEHTTPPKKHKVQVQPTTTLDKFKLINLKQIPTLKSSDKSTVTTWMNTHIRTFQNSCTSDEEIIEFIPHKLDVNLQLVWEDCQNTLRKQHEDKKDAPPYEESLQNIINLFRGKLLKGTTINEFVAKLKTKFNPEIHDFNRHQQNFCIVVQDVRTLTSSYNEIFFYKEFLRTLPREWISKYSSDLPEENAETTLLQAITWGSTCCESHNKIKEIMGGEIEESANALAAGTTHMMPTTQRQTLETVKEWVIDNKESAGTLLDIKNSLTTLLKRGRGDGTEYDSNDEEPESPARPPAKQPPAKRQRMRTRFADTNMLETEINAMEQRRNCSFCRKIHLLNPDTGEKLDRESIPEAPKEETYMNHTINECKKLPKHKLYAKNNKKWCGFCGQFGHTCQECPIAKQYNGARNNTHQDRRYHNNFSNKGHLNRQGQGRRYNP